MGPNVALREHPTRSLLPWNLVGAPARDESPVPSLIALESIER